MKGEVSEETWNAVAEVQEQYWEIMSNPETRAIAELRHKSIMDRKFLIAYAEQQARDKGKKEGKKEGRKEIAKKLKEENINIDIIEKTTGLTKEQIKKL